MAEWLGSELAVQPQTEPFTSLGPGFFIGRMNRLPQVNRQSTWQRGGSGNVSCWLTDDSPPEGLFTDVVRVPSEENAADSRAPTVARAVRRS